MKIKDVDCLVPFIVSRQQQMSTLRDIPDAKGNEPTFESHVGGLRLKYNLCIKKLVENFREAILQQMCTTMRVELSGDCIDELAVQDFVSTLKNKGYVVKSSMRAIPPYAVEVDVRL